MGNIHKCEKSEGKVSMKLAYIMNASTYFLIIHI